MTIGSVLSVAVLFIWITVLMLPWRAWSTREYLETDPLIDRTRLPTGEQRLTVLIPARNEAAVLERSLTSVIDQGPDISIVLVDDGSTDGTATIARRVAGAQVRIISGQPRPEGWTGKLWALEQGLAHIKTDLTLCLDADIVLQPGATDMLVQKLNADDLQMVSLMAHLRMKSFWERFLIPAFVYFFKMLYPFRLSNSGSKWVAAAAGGCILVRTRLIKEIGGFSAWRDSLIDDCAMARQVKAHGYRTWIGLTHAVRSVRAYDTLRSIWDMVARTAFFQLHHSTGLLVSTTLTMGAVFWVPAVGLFFPEIAVRLLSAAALIAMAGTYVPVLRFYGRSPAWSLALPLIALMYVAMTWTSAWRCWTGRGAVWKQRTY